jgi:hypothetical protein
LFAQYKTAIVLNPDPIIPASKASKKYLEKRLGIIVLKKFVINGSIE